jgi:hypothetical protein
MSKLPGVIAKNSVSLANSRKGESQAGDGLRFSVVGCETLRKADISLASDHLAHCFLIGYSAQMQGMRFVLAGQSFDIRCSTHKLERLLREQLVAQFVAKDSGVKAGPQEEPFVIEIFEVPSDEPPLFETSLLPLDLSRIKLVRERELSGWVLGDRLHLQDGQNSLDLDYQAGRARIFVAPQIFETPRLVTHTYALLPIVELLRTRGVYFIHGALVVSPSQRGVLILGAGGAGKSTCVYTLIRQGWSYVADDTLLAFLDAAGSVRLQPLMRRLTLHGTLVHHFPGLSLEGLDDQGKGIVTDASLNPQSWRAEAGVDQAVVLSRQAVGVGRSTESKSRLVPISRSILLAEFIAGNPFLFLHTHLASRHLEFLTQLCKQVSAHRLELYEDILAEPTRLARLLAQYERAHTPELYF